MNDFCRRRMALAHSLRKWLENIKFLINCQYYPELFIYYINSELINEDIFKEYVH